MRESSLHVCAGPPKGGLVQWVASRLPLGAVALGVTLGSGCVEPFRGSYVELLLERQVGDVGDGRNAPSHPEIKAGSHYTLWAGVDARDSGNPGALGVVRVGQFAIMPAVNPRSPCLMDPFGRPIMRDCADEMGIANDQEDISICEYWKRRTGLITSRTGGIRVVVSASDGIPGSETTAQITVPAADPMVAPEPIPVSEHEIALNSLVLSEGGQPLEQRCPIAEDPADPGYTRQYCLLQDGTFAINRGMAPRTLDASFKIQIRATTGMTPAQRLASCQADFKANPGYYVGNVRQLTRPASGVFYGVNRGQDPSSTGFLGGAEFITDFALPHVKTMFLMVENRTVAQATMGGFPVDPSEAGEGRALYLSGSARRTTRDITNVRLNVVGTTQLGGEVAVITELDKDDVSF